MIRNQLLAALLLCGCVPPAKAEITFMIGEPQDGSVRSGVGLISGWAVSDIGIVSVEGFIDGQSIGEIPYGSMRGDVAAAFPNVPNSLYSGWGMKWAWSLGGEGEHTLRIEVTEVGGARSSQEVTYNTVRFNSEFISNSDAIETAGATVESPVDGRILIGGALVEDEEVDIELVWDIGAQQFLIDRVQYAGTPATKQSPTVQADANLTVNAGASVSVSGAGSDPDGYISSHYWTQVSGPSVALQNRDQWTVNFTAPQTAAEIRLRLEVIDDDGLSASDDVVIQVVEPNQAPEVFAGYDQTVQTGQSVSVSGSASDSDGQIVSYSWSRIGGASVTLQDSDQATVRFTAPGTEGYVRLRLRAYDDDGASAYDDVVVHFEAPVAANQSPTADAGSDKSVETGDTVTVYGGGSDPDGTIVNWSWAQVSGTSVSLSGAGSQNVQFTAPGSETTIVLRLTVTDDDGATDSDDVQITVSESGGGGGTTTGETVFSMLDDINAARGTARTCGDTHYDAQPPLEWSASLADIAMQHSMDMAERAYFDHNTLDGPTFSQRVWPYWNGSTIGENIAASSIDRSDSYVVQLWLDSPGHCALIMSPNFTHAGIGAGHDEDNGYNFHHFWTLDFGG